MSGLSDTYGENWPLEIQRRAQDRIRTEIRLRHRQEANIEIRKLETAVLRRLDDAASLGTILELDTFADLEALSTLPRAELFKLCGQKNVSKVTPYADEAKNGKRR
jgi:hypothetical protein